jgi:hypothetical protein
LLNFDIWCELLELEELIITNIMVRWMSAEMVPVASSGALVLPSRTVFKVTSV